MTSARPRMARSLSSEVLKGIEKHAYGNLPRASLTHMRRFSSALALLGAGSTEPVVKTSITQEEIKAQRFERMMDHFQLRRVPLKHDGSFRSLTATTATVTRTRTPIPHPEESITQAPMEGAKPPRRASRHMKTRDSGVSKDSKSEIQSSKPTGLLTKAGLVLLVTVTSIYVVHLPFAITYSMQHRSVKHDSIVLGIVVDVVFLVNSLVAASTQTSENGRMIKAAPRSVRSHYWVLVDSVSTLPLDIICHKLPDKAFAICFMHMLWRVWAVRQQIHRYRQQ